MTDSRVEMGESFYCGDAAGRAKNWAPGKPRDFACSDRMFAANCNLSFHTPEEFFFAEKACVNWNWGAPNPHEFLAKFEHAASVEIPARIGKSLAEKELVVLVGFPASGKSTFAKRVFERNGFFRANNDESGSKAKSMKLAKNALTNGLSVVVDNTNPDADTRAEWIRLARGHGVAHIRCLFFSTPRDVADHLNLFREMRMGGKKRVPGVAFASFAKRFREPSVEEGFDSVTTVPFALRFESERDRQLFLMWQH
jgi:bifunctional polynucleotide phosphatase/kinase